MQWLSDPDPIQFRYRDHSALRVSYTPDDDGGTDPGRVMLQLVEYHPTTTSSRR